MKYSDAGSERLLIRQNHLKYKEELQVKGILFDIQRYSSHDGPGIRTTVFFQGCGLRCRWCHNPESFEQRPAILYTPENCIGCGSCAEICPIHAHNFQLESVHNHQPGTEQGFLPEHAHSFQSGTEQGFQPEHLFDRLRCIHCGRCAEVCPSQALEAAGKAYTLEEALQVIRRDQPFYRSSGGGVTLSGGEVLLQADFASELLKKCKEEGMHTAVDTAGLVPWEAFRKVIPFTDLFLYDIKAVTPELHKRATGADNALILENYRKLRDTGAQIWVRIPVIPGYTEDIEELRKIAVFLKGQEPVSVELLRFHRMAESKYRALGMDYEMKDTQPPAMESMEAYRELISSILDCEVRIG